MLLARDRIPPALYTFLILDGIAVGLRVWVRTVVKRGFGYDDAAMCFAYIGFLLLGIITFISLGYGFGDTNITNAGYNPILAAKFFVIAQLVYVIDIHIAKISVALVLHRLSENRPKFRKLLYISIVIFTLWTISSIVVVALQCRPLKASWGEGTGDCISATTLSNVGLSISANDITSSWLYAIMPIFLLRGVQLSPRVKISVLIVLGLGVVSGIATFLRLKSMIQISTLESAAQGTQDGVEIYLSNFMFSVIEIGLTIFTASLTALRPLLKYVPFGSRTASSNSKIPFDSGIKTIGQSSSNNHIRLEDLPDTDSGSQELILGAENSIVKKVDYRITYSGKDKEHDVSYPRHDPV